MKTNPIRISHDDHRKLSCLVAADLPATSRLNAVVVKLREELKRAEVMDRKDLPPRVVAMYSKARFVDLDTGETEEYTLVYPNEADPGRKLLSVLAPIGTAILGYEEGDELTWDTPGGTRRLRILRVRNRGAIPAVPEFPAAVWQLPSGSPRSS
ncbi:MAG: GreA/GreB family elongation factor [Opitutaceae bacterium]|nr:GreA/GreB family elongation factor [Opitutaceae bacterium]